jgi:DNA (cytosine-5)-methyltransferase 1
MEKKLESLGYSNYYKNLNAKDYGIPQNRNRTFMISVLGDYYYEFPRKKKLKLRLKDMLEDEVDEKYYLSDKLLNCFLSDGTGKYPRGERFIQNLTRPNQDIANSITTLAGNRATDNFVVFKKDTENYIEWEEKGKLDLDCRAWKVDKVSPTITTSGKVKIFLNDYKIRKLTPKECWRLMGFDDEDFDKASKVNSNAQLYKQAGNSIVVQVLENIFKELL